MSQQFDQRHENRSVFQSPTFWIGSLLWLAVVVVAILALNQKPAGPVAPETAAQPATPNDSVPAQITITTDKDGNASIKLPGESSESPWDKDGVADFAFVDTDGRTITKADLLGKPWIVCFVFTHCALTCPRVTESMRELQDLLRPYDFRLVTLTVDPVRDTPEVLKEYGRSRRADFSKWMFLGGDQREIYRLIQGSFKMPVKELQGEKRQTGFEFIHSNNIMLVDSTGVVKGKFDATNGPAMAQLRRQIKKIANRLDSAVEEPADALEPENLETN